MGAAPVAMVKAELVAPVRIESGLIQGVLSPHGDVLSFKGVPYAAPPVGALRWREPQPALKWEGIRKADKFGAICPQQHAAPGTSSEDCLFLNIWIPAKPAATKLPVLFFVHGGSYQFGSGNLNGEGLAQKGVIFISLNCRLGNFCSMGHPALTQESPLHSCANYGSLDLIAALKWIQNNIGAFGGDPAKVTISGQSTGANNVHYLSASPMAKGLFCGIIAISFPYDFLLKPQAIGTMSQAEQGGLALAKSRNIHTLEELRKIPAEDLLKGGGGPAYRSPVYPLNYPAALEQGLVSDVPTMTGLTADDFSPPAKYDPYTNIEWFHKRVARIVPADKMQAVLATYPAKTDAEAREMWKKISNEMRMADTFYWAKKRARTAKTPVFTYFFTQAQPMEPKKGAYHGSDLYYLFNDVADPANHWREEDRQVAAQVSSYVVNFVKTGNPNGPALPVWSPVDPSIPSTMVLGKTSEISPISNSRESWELLHPEQPAK